MTTSEREFVTSSPEETFELAADLGRKLRGGAVIGLKGPLGAGKTRFVQGLAHGLGVPDVRDVRSPTYVLMMEHPISGSRRLLHLDAYRLSGESELEDLGLDDHLGSGNVVVIEWYDRVLGALPDRLVEIDISIEGESERRLRLSDRGGMIFPGSAEPGRSDTVESS